MVLVPMPMHVSMEIFTRDKDFYPTRSQLANLLRLLDEQNITSNNYPSEVQEGKIWEHLEGVKLDEALRELQTPLYFDLACPICGASEKRVYTTGEFLSFGRKLDSWCQSCSSIMKREGGLLDGEVKRATRDLKAIQEALEAAPIGFSKDLAKLWTFVQYIKPVPRQGNPIDISFPLAMHEGTRDTMHDKFHDACFAGNILYTEEDVFTLGTDITYMAFLESELESSMDDISYNTRFIIMREFVERGSATCIESFPEFFRKEQARLLNEMEMLLGRTIEITGIVWP
ncbi:hypothetical protein GF325_12060 [Candidatus Bathyarchaeota archaeon]|nr:hypothetical protein [Candidatus Bathyarchaeota archaeon]